MEKPLPHSDWCYVCGDQNPLGHRVVFKTDGEAVRAYYTPHENRQGYPGVVHGGVLCTLLDETMGWSASLRHDRMFVTGELTIRFIKPFPAGELMIVEGRAHKVNRRMASVTGEVRDEAGTVYAVATGKFLPMSEEQTKEVDGKLKYGPDTISLFGRNS